MLADANAGKWESVGLGQCGAIRSNWPPAGWRYRRQNQINHCVKRWLALCLMCSIKSTKGVLYPSPSLYGCRDGAGEALGVQLVSAPGGATGTQAIRRHRPIRAQIAPCRGSPHPDEDFAYAFGRTASSGDFNQGRLVFGISGSCPHGQRCAGRSAVSGSGNLRTLGAYARVNDVLAPGAIDGARALGVRVPEDLWLIGYDDIELASWGAYKLTTVRHPTRWKKWSPMRSSCCWLRLRTETRRSTINVFPTNW
jgi:hypothetical protein